LPADEVMTPRSSASRGSLAIYTHIGADKAGGQPTWHKHGRQRDERFCD
jgi:hypothetical protein